jgi:hypothetical protein
MKRRVYAYTDVQLLDQPELGGRNSSPILNAIFVLTGKCGRDPERLGAQLPTIIQSGQSNSDHGTRNVDQPDSQSTQPPTHKFPSSKGGQFPVFMDDIIIA